MPAPERGVGRNDERARGDARGGVAVPRPDDRRRDDRWNAPRGGGYDYRNNDRYRGDDRYRYNGGARLIVPVRPLPHYYGSGGRFSVYFGLGSGYLFGSPYAGRVYGYVGPHTYGARIYYGDVRLMVRPRDAAVYVDGYYAGVVDDFDGDTFRAVYTVRFTKAVYVLHAFQKKSKRGTTTLKAELDLIDQRLKRAREDYEQWAGSEKPKSR